VPTTLKGEALSFPLGDAQLMGFKGGFAPLAGLGAQRPHLYPLPDPPLKAYITTLKKGQ